MVLLKTSCGAGLNQTMDRSKDPDKLPPFVTSTPRRSRLLENKVEMILPPNPL